MGEEFLRDAKQYAMSCDTSASQASYKEPIGSWILGKGLQGEEVRSENQGKPLSPVQSQRSGRSAGRGQQTKQDGQRSWQPRIVAQRSPAHGGVFITNKCVSACQNKSKKYSGFARVIIECVRKTLRNAAERVLAWRHFRAAIGPVPTGSTGLRDGQSFFDFGVDPQAERSPRPDSWRAAVTRRPAASSAGACRSCRGR